MMNRKIITTLERASMIYPHPIAVAYSRVLRARTKSQQFDAIWRAAEAVTRFTAA